MKSGVGAAQGVLAFGRGAQARFQFLVERAQASEFGPELFDPSLPRRPAKVPAGVGFFLHARRGEAGVAHAFPCHGLFEVFQSVQRRLHHVAEDEVGVDTGVGGFGGDDGGQGVRAGDRAAHPLQVGEGDAGYFPGERVVGAQGFAEAAGLHEYREAEGVEPAFHSVAPIGLLDFHEVGEDPAGYAAFFQFGLQARAGRRVARQPAFQVGQFGCRLRGGGCGFDLFPLQRRARCGDFRPFHIYGGEFGVGIEFLLFSAQRTP